LLFGLNSLFGWDYILAYARSLININNYPFRMQKAGIGG
jgi:hypothetical protein